MPRALALFKAQGLQVTPAPTDFEGNQAPPPGLLAWLPDADALNCSALAMKELVGLWVGRSRFPVGSVMPISNLIS